MCRTKKIIAGFKFFVLFLKEKFGDKCEEKFDTKCEEKFNTKCEESY